MVQCRKKVAENTILNARIIVPMVKEKNKHGRVPSYFLNTIFKWYEVQVTRKQEPHNIQKIIKCQKFYNNPLLTV